MMARKLITSLTAGAALLLGLVSASSVAGAAGTSLVLPQGTAFSILGASCGGIQEQAFTTGFDATSGLPTGAVYLQTRCGGSGRGGGYHTTTYSAWAGVTWDFTGAVSSEAKLATPPANLDPNFSATDAQGDQVYNQLSAINVLPANCTVGNTTYCSYRAYLTIPVPTAPSAVSAAQSGDNLVVNWNAATGPVTFSTITATPAGGGTVLTATAAGGATTGTLVGVAPSTTYSIVVSSTDAAGTGAASSPATFTTQAATVVPSAPTGVKVSWGSGGTALRASWTASSPGDSPVSDYQLTIAKHDPKGPPVVVDAGTATSISNTGFNNGFDWSVQVRAQNAAGWGPWSKLVILPAF